MSFLRWNNCYSLRGIAKRTYAHKTMVPLRGTTNKRKKIHLKLLFLKKNNNCSLYGTTNKARAK